MSSVANWSYTAKATIWPFLGVDGMTKVKTYGAPVTFDCGYSSTVETMKDDTGKEFVSKLTLFTEYSSAKAGDMVLLGSSNQLIPTIAGAKEVKLVLRDQDVFDGVADDYKIVT